jgi:ribonuclease HII
VVDSKRLSKRNRELVYERLVANAGVRWSVCVVGPGQIDSINILQATFEAMSGAVNGLQHQPVEIGEVLVDGNQVPPQLAGLQCSSLVRGDQLSLPVAAASIIAKVTRDRLMLDLDGQHPQYGFRQHQGYATKAHLEALRRHGPCPVHRMSFNPIRRFRELGSWDPP